MEDKTATLLLQAGVDVAIADGGWERTPDRTC